MEYNTRNTNDELTHWGIKGMKWGVRRYQNDDGSLTAAGKKRYASEERYLKDKEKTLKKRQAAKDKIDSLNARRKALNEWEDELDGKRVPSKPVHKKTVSEMTMEELWERTARMQAEANYYNAQKNLANANPKKVSAGQKFVSSLMNDVVAPAAKNVGKSWLENTLKDKLGLNDKDKKDAKKSIDDLTKEFKLKTYKKDEALQDIRREIQIIEAQERLDKLKEKKK